MITFNKYFKKNDNRYVDIPLETDIKLYLDPSQISRIKSPYFDSDLAIQKVSDFFQHVFELFIQEEKEASLRLIVEPREINATHLGMSSGKSKGNGPSEHLLEKTFEKLVKLAEKDVNLWNQPILIPLFVPEFGEDRFSDLLTCIILKELCEFTFNICTELQVETQPVLFSYYDLDKKAWIESEFFLPVGPDEKPIVLVPEDIVTESYSFNAQSYVWRVIFQKRQDYHLRNQTRLVQLKEENGAMIASAPTKKILYKEEVSGQYDKNKLKRYALEQTVKEPESLVHYISYVEEQIDTKKS